MGRKSSENRRAFRLYLAAGLMVLLGLFFSVTAGAQKGDRQAGKSHLADCLEEKVPLQAALTCVKRLDAQSEFDISLSRSIETLLEEVIATQAELALLAKQNSQLEAALDEKRQIITILIEQINRLKEVDIDIEKRRRNLEQ
mgnify:CR=1 FL=1